MRFPWLQVDVDFIGSRSKDLAALLRVSRREAMGLAIDLWTWVLGRSSGDTPPDGIVRGPLATVELLIAGGVDWAGDANHLLVCLETSGLLEYVDGGVRVRGTSRYRATWERNRRRHGTGAEPERNRSGSPPEPVRKTQTQTQKEDLPPPSSAAAREDFRLEPEKPRRKASKQEKATDPRHAPLTAELCEQDGWPHHGGRTAKAVTELLRLAGDAGPEEVLRRAAIARGHEGFPRVRELHELVTRWGHFAEPARRGQAPPDGLEPAAPDTCAGCGMRGQGGSVGEPEVWLGYDCGCLAEFQGAQQAGLHFTKAAEWAAQRRAA